MMVKEFLKTVEISLDDQHFRMFFSLCSFNSYLFIQICILREITESTSREIHAFFNKSMSYINWLEGMKHIRWRYQFHHKWRCYE